MVAYFIASSVQNTLNPFWYGSQSEVMIPALFGQSISFTQSVTLAPLSPQDEGFAIQATLRCPRSTYCWRVWSSCNPLQTCQLEYMKYLLHVDDEARKRGILIALKIRTEKGYQCPPFLKNKTEEMKYQRASISFFLVDLLFHGPQLSIIVSFDRTTVNHL